MYALPLHPQLYEINTRTWLSDLSRKLGRKTTLGNVPEEFWSSLKANGIDIVWLMGLWRPGDKSVEISRNHPDLKKVYDSVLPGYMDEDVGGSPFAVAEYKPASALGSEKDLDRLRKDLHNAGLGLMLDFVPNHTARDHASVTNNPDRFVHSDSEDAFGPDGCFEATCRGGAVKWIAHGRDPYFPPWTDTAQICAISETARASAIEEIVRLAGVCDGVRCDMAMLVLNQVFAQTWQEWMDRFGITLPEKEYWTGLIHEAKKVKPEFLFMAEAYWGKEIELLDLGFGYAYDKTGYDALLRGDVTAYKENLYAEFGRSTNMVRFLENHDEERMAAVFSGESWKSAALLHATSPGMRLFHHGQWQGKKVHVPVQLVREPDENENAEVVAFYERLLQLTSSPLFKEGAWELLEAVTAYGEDQGYRSIVGFFYRMGKERAIIAVNHGPTVASAFLPFSEESWEGEGEVELADRLSAEETVYTRSVEELKNTGLYVRLEPYGFHFLTTTL